MIEAPPGKKLAMLLALAVAAVVGLAAAQSSQNALVAEALFEDAQKLMNAGKTAEACEKFAASQKLDPATGTLLNLANCHEKLGKTATAWLEFSEAHAQAVRAADKQRVAYAKAHLDGLDKQLHRVIIEMLKPAKSTTVKLDGNDLAREALGTPIPLDPGPHEIVVTQPGRRTWRRTLTAGSGGTDRIEVPELEELTYGMPHEEKPPEPPPVEKPKEEPSPEQPSKGGASPLLFAGIATAAAGVGGAVVGTIFGLQAMDQASQRDKICKGGMPCRDQRAFDLDYDARQSQTIAIVSFVAGGVLAAAGVTLIVVGLGGKKPAQTGVAVVPSVAPGWAGVGLGGRF